MSTVDNYDSNTGAEIVLEHDAPNHLRPFSSIQGADLDARFELASAIMGATPLEDSFGVPFNLAHIVQQPVQVVNEVTKKKEWTYRTTLVTDDGRAFSSTSKGIDVAVSNILNSLGNPAEWGGRSFPFVGEKVGTGKTAYHTIRPVRAKK